MLQRVTPLVVQAENERGCDYVQPRRSPRKGGDAPKAEMPFPSDGGLHQEGPTQEGEEGGKTNTPTNPRPKGTTSAQGHAHQQTHSCVVEKSVYEVSATFSGQGRVGRENPTKDRLHAE